MPLTLRHPDETLDTRHNQRPPPLDYYRQALDGFPQWLLGSSLPATSLAQLGPVSAPR